MKVEDFAGYATSTVLSFAPVFSNIFAPVCIDSGAILTGVIVSVCSGVCVKVATHYIDKYLIKHDASKSKDNE